MSLRECGMQRLPQLICFQRIHKTAGAYYILVCLRRVATFTTFRGRLICIWGAFSHHYFSSIFSSLLIPTLIFTGEEKRLVQWERPLELLNCLHVKYFAAPRFAERFGDEVFVDGRMQRGRDSTATLFSLSTRFG